MKNIVFIKKSPPYSHKSVGPNIGSMYGPSPTPLSRYNNFSYLRGLCNNLNGILGESILPKTVFDEIYTHTKK